MKTRHWTALLLLVSLNANAEWTYVEGSDEYERYIQLETVIRDGQRAQIWEIDDFAKPDEKGMQSMLSRTEYDCTERNYRILYLSGHSDHMTKGETLFGVQLDGDWKPVQANTLGELSMDLACEEGAPSH